MPENTNITAAASAAQQQANTQLGQETLGSLKELEKQLQSLGGAMSKVSEDVDSLQSWFTSGGKGDQANFSGVLESSIKSSMTSVEHDRRLNEQAMRMEEKNRELNYGGPQRGDADFWAKAYAPTEKSALQTQTEAMVATFTNDSVKDKLKDIFSSTAVKSSLRSDVDDRTFGQKALDFVGLGGINSMTSWFKDRNLKKEMKADTKDQSLIKREAKEQDRLKAAYRKEQARGDKADPEKLQKLLDKYTESMNKVEEARQRREQRSADPFADLIELKDGMFIPPHIMGVANQTAVQPTPPPATPGKPTVAQNIAGEMEMVMRSSARMFGDRQEPRKGIPGQEPGKGIPDTVPDTLPQSLRGRRIDDAEYEPVAQVTEDRNEPVELAKTDGKAPKAGDAKEAADIQKKLDTQLRPDFYREGTSFFKKYLNEDLGGKKEESGGGGLGGLGKGAMYAAAAAAVGASLMKIGQAAALTKEFLDVSKEQQKIRNQIHDQGAEAQENMKKGWNDEMRDAGAELSRAEKELDNAGIFSRGKARKKVEELKKKYEQELEKTRKFTAAARAKGISTEDTEAMNKFKAEYDAEQERKAKEARAAMKAGVDANYSLSMPGQKPAAGSLEQGAAPNMVMPGSAVDTSKVETADDQAKRIEQATYDGMKRAMTDPEIKQMNEENAKATGKQINESLVGRK